MISKEEFDQIQPGDRVQIVDKWVGGGHNSEGLMDKWLGHIMTVMSRDQRDLMMEETGMIATVLLAFLVDGSGNVT